MRQLLKRAGAFVLPAGAVCWGGYSLLFRPPHQLWDIPSWHLMMVIIGLLVILVSAFGRYEG